MKDLFEKMTTTNNQDRFLKEIKEIDPKNQFLSYIVARVKRDNYRGWHSSQHNRYGLDEIKAIIESIHEVVGTGSFAIPPGDHKKDTDLGDDYKDFQEILDKVYSKIDKCTINSLKKNFFPDMDRMGFLDRPKTGIGRRVSGKLTEQGIALISKENNLLTTYKIFTIGLDKLFGDGMSQIAQILSLSDYRNETIGIYELMFILSDRDKKIDKIGLLTEYRKLKPYQKDKVKKLLKSYAIPKKFDGDKKKKRDFHNWKNAAQQMLSVMKSTVYFEVELNKGFRLNVSSTGFFTKPAKRSSVPKKDYFRYHKIDKKEKFELHHIIPLLQAKNREQGKLIDDYRNLIYINRPTHKKITKAGNKHVKLQMNPADVDFVLLDKTNSISAKNDISASYSKEAPMIKKVLGYNVKLLKSIYGYI